MVELNNAYNMKDQIKAQHSFKQKNAHSVPSCLSWANVQAKYLRCLKQSKPFFSVTLSIIIKFIKMATNVTKKIPSSAFYLKI